MKIRLADSKTRWQTATIPNWYGNTGRRVQFCSGTAIWYHGRLPPAPIRWVLIRDPEGHFDPLALLCTDPTAKPINIIADYVCRWQLAVTFEQARAHLGLETQRQWSDKAIARSTPILLALFSIVTLLASCLTVRQRIPIPLSSWYQKSLPTFSDALATVRRRLWQHTDLFTSLQNSHVKQSVPPLLDLFTEALCYAAGLDKVELRRYSDVRLAH